MSSSFLYIVTFFLALWAGAHLNVRVLFVMLGFLIAAWAAKFLFSWPFAFNSDEEGERNGKLLLLFVTVTLFKLYVSTSQTWLQEFANAYLLR